MHDIWTDLLLEEILRSSTCYLNIDNIYLNADYKFLSDSSSNNHNNNNIIIIEM